MKTCGCGCHTKSEERGAKAKKCECGCDCNVIEIDKVEKIKRSILDDETLFKMSDFYRALSDSTRLKIVASVEREEMCVSDIAVILNMTKSAVSHQLKYLKDMKLLKARKVGKVVYYALADDHVREIFDVCLEHIKEKKHEG